MKALTPLCFLTVLMALSSCAKEDLATPIDSLIFGHFYGECTGERCIETYKVEDDKLYEDVLDRYAGGDHQNFAFQPLPGNLLMQIPDLASLLPEKLYQADSTIGIPDAGDWGGIYVQVRQQGVTRWWLIDKADGNLPDWLIPFKQEVENAIEKLP
ncbi:MAG: hypothetical protein R2787_02500 [Saprospiraceae bacterium]